MSLETLKADVRYQDYCRALDRLELNIADPAFGRIVDRRCDIVTAMRDLAIAHGFNDVEERWERD